jgi:glutathione S-transferase
MPRGVAATRANELSYAVAERSITLYVDGYFVNQWDATCVVALEEKQLAYAMVRALLRDGNNIPAALTSHTHVARVPAFQHGDVWLTESSAIVEYLDDAFPDAPRLLPADVHARARARQTMAFLRSEMAILRNERAWWMCVYPTTELAPLSRNAERDVRELLALAMGLHAAGDLAAWNISHADLAFTLLRLARTGYPLPDAIAQFLDANVARPSVRAYLEHTRPPNPPPRIHAEG